jgi:RNAse (barnase) inhibitor barstar
MQLLELDAKNWKSVRDYVDALRAVLGSPEWHGNSVDAFIDSMVCGDINKVEPPYTIRIKNTKSLPADILDEINYLKNALPAQNSGPDIIIEIIP